MSSLKPLSYRDSTALLTAVGIPLVPRIATVAEVTHYPVYVKAIDATHTHKSEAGAVLGPIGCSDDLEMAMTHIQTSFPTADIIIQPIVIGREFLIGAKRDANFGIVLVLGLGGVMTNLMHESLDYIYPFTFEYFQRSLQSNQKIAALLGAYRGAEAVSLEVLYAYLISLGSIMKAAPYVTEIDVNPLTAKKDGMLIAVDWRVIVDLPAAPATSTTSPT